MDIIRCKYTIRYDRVQGDGISSHIAQWHNLPPIPEHDNNLTSGSPSMHNGSNECCASLGCVVCHRLADRFKTSSTRSASQLVDVGTQTSEASVDSTDQDPPSDRVERAKRCLDESVERVKRARIQAKRDQLRLNHQLCQERLDQVVLSLQQAEEALDDCPVRVLSARLQNVKRLHDKRQLFVLQVVEAEEAILDYEEDE